MFISYLKKIDAIHRKLFIIDFLQTLHNEEQFHHKCHSLLLIWVPISAIKTHGRVIELEHFFRKVNTGKKKEEIIRNRRKRRNER